MRDKTRGSPFSVHLRSEHGSVVSISPHTSRGDVPSVHAMTKALSGFARISRLHVNPQKTDIYFGGVSDEIKAEILQTTGYSEGNFPFRYLGLPLNSSRLTNDMFQMLLNKLKANVKNWTRKMLSYTGRI